MQLWSLFWHIRVLTDQPAAVSWIGLARFLPLLFFSLIGGLMADIYNRRKIMFVTQTAMAVVALVLGLLTWTGLIQLWHLYLLTGIQAIAQAFDLPSRQALVPNLIDNKDDLPSAFSMTSIAFDMGAIVGPALSGIVISTLGQEATYLINAVSFGAVLLALVLMGDVPQVATPQKRQNGFDREAIAEGVRFILSKPIILSSMLLDFFATFFSSANTLLPFVARDILHVDAIGYGWLSAAQSIGAVVVAVVISQRTFIRRQGLILLWAVVAFGAATILFGLSTSYVLTMLALIFIGAADAASTIVRNTIRQLLTPDYIRGRMIGINQIFFTGGPQLGEIEAGLVAQSFGTPMSIIVGGLGCILAVIFIAWRWPQLPKYNGDEALT
jgi:MFS family permease